MNNKEKEIFKKLLKIASNQQKIIQKLADSSDPNWKYDPSNPDSNWKFDPAGTNHDFSVNPEMIEPSKEDALKRTKTNFPGLFQPKSNTSVTPEVKSVYLQQDVKTALDTSPFKDKLKNNLMLNVNGTSVDVRYNLDKLNVRPETLQKHLQSLMPSLTVNTPVGNSGNLNAVNDWHPNY
jgi:hypothetical protein